MSSISKAHYLGILVLVYVFSVHLIELNCKEFAVKDIISIHEYPTVNKNQRNIQLKVETLEVHRKNEAQGKYVKEEVVVLAQAVQGSTNAEKIWNYLANANIQGVSDNPAVIAGILGNMKQESNFNPFLAGKYYGLYQTDFQGLRAAFQEEGIDKYWGQSNAPQEAQDRAIKITLDYLVGKSPYQDEETKRRWEREFLASIPHNVSNTSGETGAESFAELFMVTLERCVNGQNISDNYLSDQKVKTFVNNVMYRSGTKYGNLPYQETGKRRAYARQFFIEFAMTPQLYASNYTK